MDIGWDPVKAEVNVHKHGVRFAEAATVRLDPLALTVFDAAHGQDEMPDEIDFSQGVRGQFYRPNTKLGLPVYLDEEVQARLARLASDKGVELSDLVNACCGKTSS